MDAAHAADVRAGGDPAARSGRRQAFLTTSGNSVGAALLLVMGLRSLLGGHDADVPTARGRSAFRDGLVTSLANALLVARARRAFTEGGWGRRIERLTGAVLIGLGIRLAFERR